MARTGARRGISRRTLLVGGGAGVGLALAWGLWPRRYEPNLRAAPGETILNAFLRIGQDGRVIVALPQAELGQGVATTLPQVLADELGADWRTVGVEPAPLSPLYANTLLAGQWADGSLPDFLAGVGDWAAQEIATREALMLTGGSTSLRAFEPRLREAGAAARALLAMAAADQWGADWRDLEAHDGFVWRGEEAIAFGDLAARAAGGSVPNEVPLRAGTAHRLAGQALPRLDAPGKVDGSALFAADVRLPDMVYASLQSAPPGGRVLSADEAAADRFPEALAVFRNDHWVAVAATNSWAADRALAAMDTHFEVPELASSDSIEAALSQALDGGEAQPIVAVGDAASAVAGGLSARYFAEPAPSLPPETLTATARFADDRLEVWAPTQAPGLARAAAARATGLAEGQVTLYPMLAVGGGYGRKFEMDAIAQAASMAQTLGRPVQLIWSRIQDIRHDRPRPPALAQLEARLGPSGAIHAWRARLAAPDTLRETAARIGLGARLFVGARAPADGLVPPYSIANLGIDLALADIGFPTGLWRSGSASTAAFFVESFVDELARSVGMDPLGFRMQMLGDNPRLARALSTATALGGWDGAPSGSGMGIAAFSAYGSHMATLVEVEIGQGQEIRVLRAVCAVDCGRVVHPEIVKQQIEGGLIHGVTAAVGPRLAIAGGMPAARTLGDFALPTLATAPDVTVELLDSDEPPGGVTELAVPTAAPAIANAVHALTGQRLRRLPLRIGQ
jgi:isoquinoline 1-oxidoreductase subunit beta